MVAILGVPANPYLRPSGVYGVCSMRANSKGGLDFQTVHDCLKSGMQQCMSNNLLSPGWPLPASLE